MKLGLLLVGLCILAAAGAPWRSPVAPGAQDWAATLAPPGAVAARFGGEETWRDGAGKNEQSCRKGVAKSGHVSHGFGLFSG